MDEFSRIKTFIGVVEAGSFSEAGRLDSTVGSVTRQVRSLEDELGVRLINRNTRNLSLTEPGRLFYERARSITADLSRAKAEAASFREGVKGILRLSLRVSTGTTVIVPALPAFLKQYPELSLDIALTDQRVNLVANNIDAAVWAGNLPDSDLVARLLSPSRRLVCGSPAYFERHGVPAFPADLQHHNCLLFTAPAYEDVWEFSKAGQHEKVKVQGTLRSTNSLVLLSAAMSALGVIVVNEWAAGPLISQGCLIGVLGDYNVKPAVGDSELFVVYPGNLGSSLKVRAFVDFLTQLFGSIPTARSLL